MQQHLSVKHREQMRVVSWKLEGNPEGQCSRGRHGSGFNRRRYQGCWHSQCAFLEFYVAQYPVNQQIVVSESTMSKY